MFGGGQRRGKSISFCIILVRLTPVSLFTEPNARCYDNMGFDMPLTMVQANFHRQNSAQLLEIIE
jgi:hypothetical protein